MGQNVELTTCHSNKKGDSKMDNKTWWVVEYMDGGIKQILIFAVSAKEAGIGFKQIIRVVKYH